jgi:hypothetical protein
MDNYLVRFTEEAFRVHHKQSIETVSERNLVYTSESTGIVGRFEPVQQQVAVSPEDWDAFWRKTDQLEVWSWTTYYRLARDGGKWSLELQRGDRHVVASGRNARPDKYSDFYRCLNQLVGGRLS